MKKLNGRNLVIAPPKLLDNWRSVLFDFGVPAEIVSSGILNYNSIDYQRLLDMDFDYIFIDEAHQFRNEDTQRYDALENLCIGKKVVLITATPYNNRPLDILALLKLFQNPRDSDFINPKVKNLEEYFKKLDKKIQKARDKENYKEIVKEVADDIRENILKHILIRRTRGEIQRYYKKDLEKNKLKFPKVENPIPLFYELDENLENLFNETVETITKKLKYSRYTPLLYQKGSIDLFTKEAQQNLAGFMKAMLIKRLESSFYAFKSTLNNIINGYKIFLDLYENQKYVYFSKKYFNKIKEYIEKEDFEAVEKLIEEGKAEKISVSKFKKSLKEDLEFDLFLLENLQKQWEEINYDPKLDELKRELKRLKGKIVLFTEAEKTADYLFDNLKNEFRVLKFTGSSSRNEIQKVQNNFDANVREENQEDEFDILITTDVLSEGVNLHRSNKVINYDIPWNPVRLIQRIGRVNRVGTKFDKIFIYNFFPTHQAESEIELKRIAEMKIHAIIEMLGSDAKFLTDEEEVDSHRLFEMLNSNELFEGEEETGEELGYLQKLREIRDKKPKLFNEIKKVPKKARVGRKKSEEKEGFISFIKKGDVRKVFYVDETQVPEEIPFEKAVKIFEAKKEEKPIPAIHEFYKLLNLTKEEFEKVRELKTTPRGIEKDVLMLLARLKISRPTKISNENKQFLGDVIETIRNGVFSTYRLRTIRDEIQPLIKKQKYEESIQTLKELVPEKYIQYLKHKREEIFYPSEIILSEIFI